MNHSIDWYEMAESTDDVFGRPRVAPQGQDGTAHLTYYDLERTLSFVWNGHLDQHALVCHGGYGEPAKWTFDVMEMWRKECPGGTPNPAFFKGQEFFAAANHFQRACDTWIEWMEQEDKNDDEASVTAQHFEIYFDSSNPNWTAVPAANALFVRGVINHLRNVLEKRGHLFLNEAYDAFSVPRIREGAIMGWLWQDGNGFDVKKHYLSDAIEIEFFPDGVIYDKI